MKIILLLMCVTCKGGIYTVSFDAVRCPTADEVLVIQQNKQVVSVQCVYIKQKIYML